MPTYMLSPDGTLSALVHLPQTRPPYVVLESVSRDGRSTSRSLHVMSLAERALTLGRGHENALRIADSSISRRHASIRFENGEFLLQDFPTRRDAHRAHKDRKTKRPHIDPRSARDQPPQIDPDSTADQSRIGTRSAPNRPHI